METPTPRHPLAIEHLPSFITAPGQADFLFNLMVVFMILTILAAGVLYMRLHALPEHMAHRTQKIQLEIVAVLGLIALFTHSRIFWIAALLLAMIDLPDILSPLRSMAISLRKMARGYRLAPVITETVTVAPDMARNGAGDRAVPDRVPDRRDADLHDPDRTASEQPADGFSRNAETAASGETR